MGMRHALWGAAVWLAAAGVHGAAQAPPITADNVARFFDTAFDVHHQDHRIAGAVVAVVHRGEVQYLGGYGWADVEARVPADPRRSAVCGQDPYASGRVRGGSAHYRRTQALRTERYRRALH